MRSSTVELSKETAVYLTITTTKESKIRYIVEEVGDLIATLEV